MSGERARLSDLGDGIYQITQPLPWALDHVHCYALADPDGWTIIDTGLGTPGTDARWRSALAELGSPRIRRIVITHYHPDHIGNGAALARLTGAPEIVQGRYDAQVAEQAWGASADGERFRQHLLLHGMPEELAAGSADAEGDTPVEIPQPTLLVSDGHIFQINGEPFRVLELPGHADGHIALLGERSGRLFGGDVLLNEITPNIARWEDSLGDPLGKYLTTLTQIEELSPRRVYPGHRTLIEDPRGRAREIAVHHAERLDHTEQALRGGASTAYEVGLHIWGGNLGFHEQRFALVEAVAHLERLEQLGRAAETSPGRWALPA